MGFSLHFAPTRCLATGGWTAGLNNPTGTTLLFDVLTPISNPFRVITNLSLPAPLALTRLEHPTVHVRVRMATNDTYVTPMVHSLSVGRTTYIGPQHVVEHRSGGSNQPWTANGRWSFRARSPCR